MRLLLTAGGGGHFAPALSVLGELPGGVEVLFVGRKYSIEKDKTISFEHRMAEELDIPFQSLETGKLQRKFSRTSLQSLAKVPKGLFQAITILRTFRPDVVLSFGGYISLPVTIAAKILKIPVVIHEQTMVAGLSNKIAASFARTICISWEDSARYFPKEKIVLTGNPLRKEILDSEKTHVTLPELESLTKPLIYVTGGSLGSHVINELVRKSLPELLKKYTVFHQTGDAKEFNDFAKLETLQNELSEKNSYVLRKFLTPSEVAAVFHKSSLVIGRAGANTMMEILYFGKPAILLPIHVGQKNEQETNATFLHNIGLAEILHDDATPEELITLLDKMFATIKSYDEAAHHAKKYIKEDSAKRILDEVAKAVSKSTKGKE